MEDIELLSLANEKPEFFKIYFTCWMNLIPMYKIKIVARIYKMLLPRFAPFAVYPPDRHNRMLRVGVVDLFSSFSLPSASVQFGSILSSIRLFRRHDETFKNQINDADADNPTLITWLNSSSSLSWGWIAHEHRREVSLVCRPLGGEACPPTDLSTQKQRKFL